MKDVRMEINLDLAEKFAETFVEDIVLYLQGGLLDNWFFDVGNNAPYKLGRKKIRRYIAITERYVNDWTSTLDLFMTDSKKKFNELLEKFKEAHKPVEIMNEFYDTNVDFLELDNYMTSHGYYSTWEDCREDPALAVEIKKDGWLKYVPISDDMEEIKILFDVTADNGKEEPPYCFYMRVKDVYEV